MRFLIFKINTLPTPVRERVTSRLLRKHGLCLHVLSAAATSPGSPCQSANKAAVGKGSWGPPQRSVFFSFWLGHLFISTALTGRQWLRLLPSSPLRDLTTHSKKAPRTDAKQMLSTWKRHGCFHWPLQSACQVGGDEEWGETEEDPSRAPPSTPSCQKNRNQPVCLLTKMSKPSLCLGFYIDNIRAKKKKVKEKEKPGIFFSSLPNRISSKNHDL